VRRLEALRQGLRDLGYVEGQNIAIEPRWTEGGHDRYSDLAADLVRSKVDVIVAVGGAAAKAAQQATRTTPIVMSVVGDPVGIGLVASLARPGGNVTGTSLMTPDLIGKQFELLREVAPRISRIALLWNPANPSHASQITHAKPAARSLGVQLQLLEVRDLQEINRAFAAITRERAEALVLLPDAIFTNHVKQIAPLAAHRGLPSIFGVSENADEGGLMVYSADFVDLERRAAAFVDKLIKGARPADLPVEQPTKFELVINLKTAKALGLTIPPSLLLRAERVID